MQLQWGPYFPKGVFRCGPMHTGERVQLSEADFYLFTLLKLILNRYL